MKVLVAMSGGVDSSVAALVLRDAGHDVVGVTLKLWGGPSDSGCCSVSDVDDARRVADRLGIDHHVMNLAEEFERFVVQPYVDAHRIGHTPNPCIECNRHIKFDVLVRRAEVLGFDFIATGHHARVAQRPDGTRWIRRGVDRAKDQSYVLGMLGPDVLNRLLLPIGDLTKAEVRDVAAGYGLRIASKPDSQDVCFITASAGRRAFLGARIPLRPGRVIDQSGAEVGTTDAVELATIGQRKGLTLAGGSSRRYVLDVDPSAATIVVGSERDLAVNAIPLDGLVWTNGPVDDPLLAQTSAHGEPVPGSVVGDRFELASPRKKVAPGQTVVLYDDDVVVASCFARSVR